MDPIAATSVHCNVWEPFVSRRSKVPTVQIDLLKGAVAPKTGTAASLFDVCTSTSHPAMKDKIMEIPEVQHVTGELCENFLKYLLSDDTALPTHELFAHGNATCVGLLAEVANDEAAVAERKRAEAQQQDEESPEDEKNKADVEGEEQALVAPPPGLIPDEFLASYEEGLKEHLEREAKALARRESAGKVFVPLLDQILDVTATHALTTSASQSAALKRADKEYGCVVYGAYGCVDDAQWSSSTRSFHCHDLYDVFVVMRMSMKLASDLRRQLGIVTKDESEQESPEEEAEEEEDYNDSVERQIDNVIDSFQMGGERQRKQKSDENTDQKRANAELILSENTDRRKPTALIRLMQHKAFAEGAEFRAFVLIQKIKEEGEEESLGLDITVLGICQKRVDQVFEFLLDEEHNMRIAEAAEDVIVKLFSQEVEIRPDNEEDGQNESDRSVATLGEALYEELVGKDVVKRSGTNGATKPDRITDIVVGIDIIIESASLPIYVLGMTAVASGSEQWPFLTEEEKCGSQLDAATTKGSLKNPFLGPIIEKQSIPFCRLFRTLADLKAHYVTSTKKPSASTPNPKRLIFAASYQSDLVGDGKQMFSHTTIPKELQDTESFLEALKRHQGEEEGGAGGSAGGAAHVDDDPASLASFMRHLENQH